MFSLKDGFNITGDVFITVTDETGKVKYTRDITNLVVTTGKNHIASRIAGIFTGEGAVISHIGFGTGSAIPIPADTSLSAALGTRAAISSISHIAGTNVVTVSATFTGYAGNITEAGMFNALTGGTMVCRTTFGAVPILATDGLSVIWTLTIN